jgi:hypothetical protein
MLGRWRSRPGTLFATAAVSDPELRAKIEPLIMIYQHPPVDEE